MLGNLLQGPQQLHAYMCCWRRLHNFDRNCIHIDTHCTESCIGLPGVLMVKEEFTVH